MGKKTDLTGIKVGHLTVLGESSRRDKSGCVLWVCQCDCEDKTLVEVRSTKIRSGNPNISCGCVRNNKTRQLNYKNLVGQTFGNLTVLEETSERYHGAIVWKCQCACGNYTTATTCALKSKGKTSCGCLHSQGEQQIQKILQKHNIPYKTEYSFKDCLFPDTLKMAKFDFYVDDKYIIEYDGKQHFEFENSGWNTLEHLQKTQEHDKIKNEYCFMNNIPVIRIPYTHLPKLSFGDLILETSPFLLKKE